MKSIILVVDDDIMVLFIHEAVISGSTLKAHCEYVSSATSALDYIDNEQDMNAKFLIFLDINMPVMNGWQMLEKLKVHPKKENILVVIVSSSVNQTDTKKAFSYEMVIDYVAKPLKEIYLENLSQDERLLSFFE